MQDGASCTPTPTSRSRSGSDVTIGHRAVVHGCTVEDDSLVGMGAVLLNGAVLGSGLAGRGRLGRARGDDVPPGSLVAGVPAKVKRPVTDAERERIRCGAASYVSRARDLP